VLAHEAFNLLVIDEHALLSQGGANPSAGILQRRIGRRADNHGCRRAFAPRCAFQSPLYKLQLQRLLADEAFEGGDPRFVLFDQISGDCVFVERAGLESLDPECGSHCAIARSASPGREASHRRGTPVRPDVVGAVFRYGLSSFESPAARSIATLNPVRPKGPTPIGGQIDAD
jgi:hypothetical protein